MWRGGSVNDALIKLASFLDQLFFHMTDVKVNLPMWRGGALRRALD